MTTGETHTSGETPRRAAKPAGGTRDAIVDALLRLAARREFADTTISDIAREAGVSLADFRDAFPSKNPARRRHRSLFPCSRRIVDEELWLRRNDTAHPPWIRCICRMRWT